MKLLKVKQRSPEWDELRKTKVGASDIGILMEGTEREIYNLLQVKRGLAKTFVTAAMEHGSNMEDEAIEWFIGRKPTEKEKPTALHDKPDDWLMASYDFFDSETNEGLEVKCPQVVLDMPSEHSAYKKWWWQVQTQMAVSGQPKWPLVVYSPLKQKVEWIDRDEASISRLKEKGRWFYDILVNFKELPAPAELEERADQETLDWANYARQVYDKKKEIEELWEVVRDEGVARAGDAGFICSGLKVSKIENKPKIDYEAACIANKIDLNPFVKPPKSPFTWRVSVT